jgi:xanthine dehydrogenase accessory factor
MDSADLQVLSSAIAWRCSGHGVTLATVVRTWGSAPRPPGAWLAIREDGQVVGSVSGGCVEEDLITRVRERRIEGALPSVLTYGVTKEEAERFGLPCGGTLQLVIEPHPDLGSLQALLARLERRETVARTLDMGTGSLTLAEAKRSDALQFDATRLTTIHGPRYRLLIIGAGQLSRYLAQMAGALDYQVVVCDPREEYNLSWDVPGADLVTTMPDDTVLAMRLDACSAVVALTHDPKLDDMALLEALKSRAFYVGALGSRANNAKRRDRLREHFDLTESELARLHGPVGLPIGSRTPPEIAVSILAEITGVKNGATYAAARVPGPHSAAEQAAGCGVP